MHRSVSSSFGLLLGASLLCATPACSSSSSEGTPEQTLEVFNWWTNPGETDAAQAIFTMYEKANPQTHVINAAVENIDKAQAELQSRMTTGAPPDTFQAIGGWNLWEWVAFNGKDDTDSKLENVDAIAAANGLAAVTPQPLLDVVSYNNHVYSIPIGTHRFNTLFYNKKIFAQYGLTPPTTWDEFYQVGDALKAQGITPLAIGAKDGFYVSIVVWDGMLIARSGVPFRESYFGGTADPADPAIADTLTEMTKVFGYTNDDRSTVDWDGAAQEVVDGKAAMTIIGDWAKGFFLSQGWQSGVDLGAVPTPGTQGTFVYIADSFTLPLGVPDRAAAVTFLNMIATAKAQDVFNPIKGAIPTRSDTDISLYDSLAVQAISDFENSTLTRARPVLVKSPAFLADVDTAMSQFAIDLQVDTVVNVMKNRYDELAP
jgi:glucose/mannose transport system substrate-binding protein